MGKVNLLCDKLVVNDLIASYSLFLCDSVQTQQLRLRSIETRSGLDVMRRRGVSNRTDACRIRRVKNVILRSSVDEGYDLGC